MNREYIKKHTMTYTELDSKLQMDLVSSFNLAQNIVTEYFESFKSDNIRLKKNNKAIWVVTKTKIHYNKYPKWRDLIQGRSYTIKVKPIRVEMESTFKNNQDEILFIVKQESCAIDLESRKIRKINTVDYPEDMDIEKSVLQEPYLTLKEDFSEKDYIYQQKVLASDIDYSNHTNNVSYVKYIVNSLNCKFFEENQITDFEIHYINESKEGQILKVYKKEKNNNSMEFLIKEQDREIIRANLNYIKV